MPDLLSRPAMAVLRRLEPELAHRAALWALSRGLAPSAGGVDDPALAVRAMGLDFANPIGLAAGFDKDGVAAGALSRAGFGFVEIGTLTPRPQPGNPRPRMFRLPEHGAVINRMGFNNGGVTAALARLRHLPARPRAVPLGINVGINKEGAEPLVDYPNLLRAVAGVADYVVVNVSSPNTPGLRDLQGEAALDAILSAMTGVVAAPPPLLVKVAPDLSDAALVAVTRVALRHGLAGLIVSNTTIARPGVATHRHAAQAGGLSGRPLLAASTRALAVVAREAQGRLTLIGAGGVSSGADALAKIRAGAHLVQVYTAFAYAGPALLGEIKAGLIDAMHTSGYVRLADAVGVDAARLAMTTGASDAASDRVRDDRGRI